MSTEPAVAEITVPTEQTAAFVAFTAQMGEWWDAGLTPDAATFTSIEIDPDGEVAMVHEEDRHVWGRVTTWEPPREYAQDFWLGQDPDRPGRLRVTFEQLDGSTRVRVEHHDGPDGAADLIARWEDLLRRYAGHVS